MRRRPGDARVLVPALACVALAVTGCSSSARTGGSTAATSASTSVPPSTAVATSATTVAGQQTTVYDCGGGAYEPATLLVVCGVNSTVVTDVHWTSWTATSATGTGNVHLPGKSPSPASLALSDVVSSGSGPQFAQLKATWSGTSPDGHPYDVYPLGTAPTR